MNNEQHFLEQFEDAISRMRQGNQQDKCRAAFYNIILPKLKPYLGERDVVLITKDEPSLYIVLQRKDRGTIHFEMYLDTWDAFYAVFKSTDMQESNAGSIEEVLTYVVDVLNPVVTKFTGTQEGIQKGVAWAEENMKI